MKFEPIAYASHYGGQCRGCADENGVCPTSGLPCDPDERLKAAAHCLKAWQYGIEHGHMDNPFAPAPVSNVLELHPDVINLVIAAREFWDDNNDLSPESQALDKALEPFSALVPYQNEPEEDPTGYCTDCDSRVTVVDGRCLCGSGRVVIEALSAPATEADKS